jgi:hypothetical protein
MEPEIEIREDENPIMDRTQPRQIPVRISPRASPTDTVDRPPSSRSNETMMETIMETDTGRPEDADPVVATREIGGSRPEDADLPDQEDEVIQCSQDMDSQDP